MMMSTIRLFLPPILGVIKRRLFSRNKETDLIPLPQRKHLTERMVVLGNGPSLQTTIELYSTELRSYECMAVNYFAISELYDLIRPAVYVLMDPIFFTFPSSVEKTVLSLYDNLVNKTTWSLTLVMPVQAKDSFVVSKLSENSRISVEFVGGCYEVPNGFSKYEAWDHNVLFPPSQTVLNTCVYLSIYWGYPETFLVGADTSFLADLRVDQETNELYTIDTHFYKKDLYKDPIYDKNNRRVIGTTLHEELQSIATALSAYWDLKFYADWKGVKVYNASEYSWIDAFERKKLR